MEIKKATLLDIVIIKQLAYTIWPVCYNNIISNAQIDYMLKLMYDEAALENQINKGHQFIIAWENEQAIGFASYGIKSDREPTICRLHKLYALPTAPIKGIGTAMLNFICTQSKLLQCTLLELNVNKQNSATVFYNKKGFTILKEEVLNIGQGYVMDDYVMGLLL